MAAFAQSQPMPRFWPALVSFPLFACSPPAEDVVQDTEDAETGDDDDDDDDADSTGEAEADTGDTGDDDDDDDDDDDGSTGEPAEECEEWTRLLGSEGFDAAFGLGRDGAGAVYISGGTTSALPGARALGSGGAFIARYDEADGTREWVVQFGTDDGEDRARLVEVAGDGGVYAIGFRGFNEEKEEELGESFLTRFDADGNQDWDVAFAAPRPEEEGYEISLRGLAAAEDGSVVVSGFTAGPVAGEPDIGEGDAFIARYAADGELQWVEVIGTDTLEFGDSVALDAEGNAYVIGMTEGQLEGQGNANGTPDAFIAKYSPGGEREWLTVSGTETAENAWGVVAADDGSLFMSGHTLGSYPGFESAGGWDSYITRLGPEGEVEWTYQQGGPFDDLLNEANVLDVDEAGNVYLAGNTRMSPAEIDTDIYVTKLDPAGELAWTRFMGSEEQDSIASIEVTGEDELYLTGWVSADYAGESNSGGADAVLQHICGP